MKTNLFTWLHLSDIHQGHGGGEVRWDQRFVLEALRKDVGTLSLERVPHPEAILVTGDIAFSGNSKVLPNEAISKEYERAGIWIDSVAQSINCQKSSVFTVPGNHDVPRIAERQKDLRRLVDSIRRGDDSLDDVLEDIGERAHLLARMKSYNEFSSRYGTSIAQMGNDPELSWLQTINTPALTIRIVGINTSLLAADNKDRKLLRVGKEQLQNIAESPKNGEATISIILSHHPFDWLADEDEVYGWARANTSIHLCGHIHTAESELRHSGSGQGIIRIVSGAAHGDSEEVIGHGYNVSALVATDDGQVHLRTWPRIWSDKNKRFQADLDNTMPNQNFAEHKISVTINPLDLSKSPAATGPETLSGATSRDSGRTIIISVHQSDDVSRPIKLSDLQHPPCDSPPTAPTWVGRAAELDILNDSTLKVAVITGIGGQGKSMLAATHIETAKCEFWDWRDCRELGDTLQTHLVRIIERLSNRGITSVELSDQKIDGIVDVLFTLLAARKRHVLVFDNIDHYIDADTNRPTGGMQSLMEAALRRSHQSIFIFTCRPAVTYDDPSFYNLSLSGLSAVETQRLFELRGVDISEGSTKRHIADAQMLTQGHPLWLNLMATQVSKNKVQLPEFLSDIRRGVAVSLSRTMLGAVWKTLNSNQQDVLRCMAEAVRAETEKSLSDYLEGRLNYNRVNRALKVLVGLNLVVVRSSPGNLNTFELHPLVREYIRANYRLDERRNFIDPIIRAIERILEKFRPRITEANFSVMENWSVRAELAMNSGNLKDAMSAIAEVKGRMLSSGHMEEFIRIAGRLFGELDWLKIDSESLAASSADIDNVFSDYVSAIAEMGRPVEVDQHLDSYERSLLGKSARFIHLCSMRSHSLWVRGDFDAACLWGEKGQEVKRQLGGDTRFSSESNLALALRDSGRVDESMALFLAGSSVDAIIADSDIDWARTGHFYGNIGRCLWLKGDVTGAIVCYRKSALVLDKASFREDPSNLGWSRYWIGEALERTGDDEMAFCFFRDALTKWRKTSLIRSRLAETAMDKIGSKLSTTAAWGRLRNMTDAAVDNVCQVWLSKPSMQSCR